MSDAALLTGIPWHDLSIFSTDFAPDRIQAQILETKVEDDRKELVFLNSKLTQLQRRARELQARINEVEGAVSLNKALLSPTRRLPPETLGEVFKHCLPQDVTVTVSPICAPLLLTHVCRRWKRVAYGTPSLWKRLYLGRGFSHNPSTLVPLWLRNSGALPLDIRINVEEWHINSGHGLMEGDVTRLLTPSIHRCRSLVGSLSISAIEQVFGHDLLLPELQSLELHLPTWSSEIVPRMGSLRTPRLRSLILNDTGFVTEAISGPLSSMRYLGLTGQKAFGLLSHSGCLDFIALCPNLQSCTLTLSKDPGIPLHRPVVLDSLRHLHLVFRFSLHDPIPFLDALRSQFIEQLTLQNHGGVSPIPHIRRVIHSLLSGRPQTIKELNLSSLYVPTSDWVPSLRKLTELTTLSIFGDSLDGSFFDLLTAEKFPAPWTCPLLTTLKLHHVAGLLGPLGDRLVAFVRSRAPYKNDGRNEMADDRRCLTYVSLTLCHLERRQEDELQDIEQKCNGALRIQWLTTF